MNPLLSALGVLDAAKSAAPKSEVIGFAPSPEAPALRPFQPEGRVLKSELPGVSNEAYTHFVFVMKVAALGAVSPSNGLGMFDMRYKRLADLGIVENPRYKRDVITNRSVQIADWVAPLTREGFLKSASVQYKVFVASMGKYFLDLRDRRLVLPQGVTASGALAILHRGGPGALTKWSEPDQQFESTRELFAHANGVF